MSMTEKQFKQCLILYGTEIDSWPEEIMAEAMQMQHRPVFANLVIEQQYFEEMLLNNRQCELANTDLANRIISAARTVSHPSDVSVTAWLKELLNFIMPQPSFALATVLTLGIIIGLTIPPSSPAGGDDILSQAYFEDEGVTL